MSQFNSTSPTKPWNIHYTSSLSDHTPPQSQEAPAGGGTVIIGREEAPWKSFGTSMSAISFGFVATAILISMFLIMAIFEHLFRPNDPSSSFSSPQDVSTNLVPAASPSLPPRHLHKLKSTHMVEAESSYGSSDYSVVMPGHEFPSYIAQPAPLLPPPPPCSRERISWPSHT